MDEALIAAAPPLPLAAPAPLDELAPAPESVAALLDDTLEDTFDPESWRDDPLATGEAPTARLGKRPRLPSLAYLEGDERPGLSC